MTRVQPSTKIIIKKLLSRRGIIGKLNIIKTETIHSEFFPDSEIWDEIVKEICWVTISRYKTIMKISVDYRERRYTIERVG